MYNYLRKIKYRVYSTYIRELINNSTKSLLIEVLLEFQNDFEYLVFLIARKCSY